MHIPDHWRWATIADVQSSEKRSTITGPFGSSIGKKFFVEHGVPVIRGNNLSLGSTKFKDEGFVFVSEDKAEELRGYKALKHDLIFTAAGTIGQVGIIPENTEYEYYIISNKQMRVRFDTDKVDPLFAYYWFSSPWMVDYIKRHDTGSTIPLINLGVLRSLPMPLPPVVEQVAIRQYLFMIDEKINNNSKINQTLEQMAQALFKSWFVDFEPVKAKIAVLEAGGSQEDATLAAMTAISGKDADALAAFEHEHPEQYAELKATAELFPSAMRESEVGEIPGEWALSEIGAQIDIAGGATPSTKTPEFWDKGDIHWTTPKDLSNVKDKILLDTERKITQAGLGKISSGLLPVNTVLMSSRAPVGYLAIAKIPVAINQGYIAMKCNKELSPEFVLQWCSANMPEIVSRASGTTFAEISKKNFNPIPLVKPPVELVKIYTTQVSAIYSVIENTMREINSLTQLRDTLLPKLLSGEITLPEAEQAVSEAENV